MRTDLKSIWCLGDIALFDPRVRSPPGDDSLRSVFEPLESLGREEDADAIVRIIEAADVFVRVAVMDYFPATIYGTKTRFWPVIDNAIRRGELKLKNPINLIRTKQLLIA